MNNDKIFWVGAVFLCLAFVVFAGYRRYNEDSTAATAMPSAYWLTDFDKAKQLARQQDKDLLIDFAGSDWCYWCKKLDREVFSKTAFLEPAGRQFVFVLIDFPNDTSGQSDELQKQNERLAQQFGVQGFPTVFLADADGRPYAKTGYMEGGPQAYLDHVKELRNQKTHP